MTRKVRETAAELMARLNADPEWVAREKARDEEFRRKGQELARAEAPLVKELQFAGLTVNSVWDLVNGRYWFKSKVKAGPHARVLPILLAHLERPYPDAIRDGVARAMAIPAARFAWPVLVKLFRQEQQESRTKQGLAVALSNIADDELLDELINLIRDPQNGMSRALLLRALEVSHRSDKRKVLMEFGGDPLLHREVQEIFRRLDRAKRRVSGTRRIDSLE
jgi:hypothetical protein